MTIKDIDSWIAKNRFYLSRYKGQYVAITDRVIAYGDNREEVNKIAREKSKDFVLYFVHKYIDKVIILPIYFSSISVQSWRPFYDIELQNTKNEFIKDKALIDSGADISCISYKLGLNLGFQKYPQEAFMIAYGIVGEIKFLQREITIKIDNHQINIPIAWIQDEDEEQMELVIGREKVFDKFDITFKQADRKIEFNWRE